MSAGGVEGGGGEFPTGGGGEFPTGGALEGGEFPTGGALEGLFATGGIALFAAGEFPFFFIEGEIAAGASCLDKMVSTFARSCFNRAKIASLLLIL